MEVPAAHNEKLAAELRRVPGVTQVGRLVNPSARGTVSNDSVEALAGMVQLTTTVAPKGRNSTSAPPAAASDRVKPPPASTRIPGAGAAPFNASSRGKAGTASSAIGSSDSAENTLTCSGSEAIGCAAASPTTPPTTPATSG